MSAAHSVLLVGEGNFSFSAALSRVSVEAKITATCPQRQEDVLKHEGTATNIQIIKDAGGVVLFEVDCTKLGACASLLGLRFDRVVFNFPHCGRKSGVKKNRELLKNFFLSCVQVLAEDGEVHVALCNGQGGTPADQPTRAWHNSWQVVTMAAEAQLILSAVRPFEIERVESYRCTGYRSQDKGFHVENALNHVFTRGAPYSTTPRVSVDETVDGERVQYDLPAELSDYLSRDFLSEGSIHPVRLVQDFLLKGLEERWPVTMTTRPFHFLLNAKQVPKVSREGCDTCCYVIPRHAKDPRPSTEIQQSVNKRNDHSKSSDTLGQSGTPAEGGQSGNPSNPTSRLGLDREGENRVFVLRPSLFPQMEETVARRPEGEQRDGGRVPGNHTGKEGSCDGVGVDRKEKGTRGEDCPSSTGSLFGISGLVFRDVPVDLWAPPAFHELLLRGVFPAGRDPVKTVGQALKSLLGPHGVSLAVEREGLRLMAQPMGLVGEVLPSVAGVGVSINLDLLAAVLYSLPDWRLLWSRDPRFLERFSPRPPPGKPCGAFSLFAQSFRFDISFWAGPDWEERKFHALVREASCGTAAQVTAIDTFPHPEPSKISYCYRIIYHSHSHALSHTKAIQFHRELETLLSSRLHVTIR